MEISIAKETFIRGLHLIQSIVEKRNTMPILANALIKTDEGRIDILATDLEVGIKESVEADVKSEGAVTLSARKLFEIVKELPTDELSLRKKDNNWVEISSGKAQFSMVGIDPEDFPSFPSHSEVEFMKVEARVFKEMIEKTIIAVSTDETRYNLNGVFFEGMKDGGIRMVATDGHRLALSEKGVDGQKISISEKGCIIPRKGVQEFKKLLEEEDGRVEIGFKENRAILKSGNVVVVVRLIEGEFPDYKPVIPAKNETPVSINRGEFIKSLRRISILSDEKTKGVRFDFSDKNLTLSTTNPGLGEAKEEIGIDYSGKDVTIGFNARYVLDFLNVMAEEDVTMYVTDELSAALINDGDRDDFTGVVMPMRT